MPNVEKVSVSMKPQHAALLRDAVSSGAYASGSEVVRDAMRDWSAKWMQTREDIAKLRAMWEKGKANGPPVDLEFDAVLDAARQEIVSAAPHAR